MLLGGGSAMTCMAPRPGASLYAGAPGEAVAQ